MNVVGKVDSIESSVNRHGGSIHGLRSRKADESDVERVEERVESDEREREEDMTQVDKRLDAQEAAIRELREENEQLRAMLEAVQEEMAKGRLDRLRERFGG